MKKIILLFTVYSIILFFPSCVLENGTGDDNNTIAASGSFCQDKNYTENTVFLDADISTFINDYTKENAIEFRTKVLKARYPMGDYIMQTSHNNGVCDDYWNDSDLTGNDTAMEDLRNLSTTVHECGHGLDGWLSSQKGWYSHGYFINPDLTLYTENGNAHIADDPHPSFTNHLLQADEYGAGDWPVCENSLDDGCDFYSDTYLADDFMGNQGFETITEELTQYINSLALGYAFQEAYEWNTSARNGMLTFMMYLERYLLLARTEHKEFYEFLAQDEDWKKLIGTIWDRAWYYYELTKELDTLAMQPDETTLYNFVSSEKLISEICSIRGIDSSEDNDNTDSDNSSDTENTE